MEYNNKTACSSNPVLHQTYNHQTCLILFYIHSSLQLCIKHNAFHSMQFIYITWFSMLFVWATKIICRESVKDQVKSHLQTLLYKCKSFIVRLKHNTMLCSFLCVPIIYDVRSNCPLFACVRIVILMWTYISLFPFYVMVTLHVTICRSACACVCLMYMYGPNSFQS